MTVSWVNLYSQLTVLFTLLKLFFYVLKMTYSAALLLLDLSATFDTLDQLASSVLRRLEQVLGLKGHELKMVLFLSN